nr:hypothetical protein [Neobacillus sp. Marseille-Q6967]
MSDKNRNQYTGTDRNVTNNATGLDNPSKGNYPEQPKSISVQQPSSIKGNFPE